MSFPSAPVDGQFHNEGNVFWTFNNGVWRRNGASRQIAEMPAFRISQNSANFSGNSPVTNIGGYLSPNSSGLVLLNMYYTGGNIDLGLGNYKINVAFTNSKNGQIAYSDFWRHAAWDSYQMGDRHGISFAHSFRITNAIYADRWQILISGTVSQVHSGAWRDQIWSASLFYNEY